MYLFVNNFCSYVYFYLSYLWEDKLLLLVDLKEVDLVENNNLLLVLTLDISIYENGPLFCPSFNPNDPPILMGLVSA